jgi:hypothetical protein
LQIAVAKIVQTFSATVCALQIEQVNNIKTISVCSKMAFSGVCPFRNYKWTQQIQFLPLQSVKRKCPLNVFGGQPRWLFIVCYGSLTAFFNADAVFKPKCQ